MFEIGDYVVNANNGICRIKEIVQMDTSGDKHEKSYFLLIPVGDDSGRVFIPVDNAHKRIRNVVDKDTALAAIDSIPEIQEIVITNEKEREAKYKEAVKSCEIPQLISLIKCLRTRYEERTAQGKKATAVDERYYKIAEHNLNSELAFAIGIDKKEVGGFIEKRLGI